MNAGCIQKTRHACEAPAPFKNLAMPLRLHCILGALSVRLSRYDQIPRQNPVTFPASVHLHAWERRAIPTARAWLPSKRLLRASFPARRPHLSYKFQTGGHQVQKPCTEVHLFLVCATLSVTPARGKEMGGREIPCVCPSVCPCSQSKRGVCFKG